MPTDAAAAEDGSPTVAIVDGGSFVLPYDLQLIQALAGEGVPIAFFGSTTRYNADCLAAMGRLDGVTVRCRDISGSVASRWRGAAAYVGLWLDVVRAWPAVVNLQFSAAWPVELPFLLALRRRFVFTVHNAVPHGFAGRMHRPTRWLARLARTLVFASPATRDDFLRRYGQRFAARSIVVPHGLLPIAPVLPSVDYRPRPAPRALIFWSTVKPYKGVELFADLARDPRIRAMGLSLEVHGRWDPALAGLRGELAALGVTIVDRYLDAAALQALVARDAVFLLPYRDASQSGALYTLLHHGCTFACTDAGDLGGFMRRFGLTGLLLPERSADAVVAMLEFLRDHAPDLALRLQRAQDASRWTASLPAALAAYRPVPQSGRP